MMHLDSIFQSKLKSKEFVRYRQICQENCRMSKEEILKEMMRFYKNNIEDIDLLCEAVIQNKQQVIVSLEKYSNLLQGKMHNASKQDQIHSFKKCQIKSINIVALIKVGQNVAEIKSKLAKVNILKKKPYVNKFLKSTIVIQQRKRGQKQQNPQNLQKIQKLIKTKSEDKKKINEKPQPSKPKQKEIKELPKSKAVQKKKSQPILTTYPMARRQLQSKVIKQEVKIVPETIVEQKVQPRKLKFDDSDDEEVFTKQKFNLYFTPAGKQKQTDHSANKQSMSKNKMEVEVDQKEEMKNFLANDESDEDEELFVKMEKKQNIKVQTNVSQIQAKMEAKMEDIKQKIQKNSNKSNAFEFMMKGRQNTRKA